ncbi:inorganic phosphate transporter [Bradyrhizobium sp. ISRA443]|uniref:inorganic phosphate transporter n=1 Tax=unclassified Bradyrhizobium TaxID=2631580 RepID=UPI00247892A4|nr:MULTISPECIES: inorganic phosphate transporter [unclassified Bradyrhizobium]WGR91316.1 inorganic phosphate transporter [Bradyrhizobium sp. ISRA435]WGS01543.1 inorganic phosphate transporter [Bradyrhizobium sp. ISRA436]WGS08430.1 inorganic phosphate transporter [Bradyrhizobium sp. ISRA437]WGS15318.1 inorganic phosphate transporter [Bradyrhizobium sp. ISRA443]
MSDVALPGSIEPALKKGPDLDKGFHPLTGIIYMGVVSAALLFVAYSIYADIDATGARVTSYLPFILLFVALLIALGFEFVNGFHDTANAVATVIYTRSLPAHVAVVWSGMFNLFGVLLSSGAVAFGIVSLLPVELILQVGSSAGFAMVFALLIAAIIWNLGTWWLGLPASSSHTLIGSIMGVGITNALLRGRDGTSGVDWSQAVNIAKALLLSPLFGFVLAALLLYVLKAVLLRATPKLFGEPVGDQPPPWWIRGILILTCTLVSFFHGSNDGQKGMGLIMLILIGTVPTAYALNRALPSSQIEQFAAHSAAASKVIEGKASGYNVIGNPRPAVTNYVSQHQINEGTFPSLAVLVRDIGQQVAQYGSLAKFPAHAVGNTRNDMYLASEAIRFLMKDKEAELSAADVATLNEYKGSLDNATKFIPSWVKFAVAIALGLGTMVGWKRIVVTVGEKIGKTHLTYAQGACAEITAAATIAAADGYGLPVSTTHVLSSGIAGTMAANGSGLQWTTIRNIAMAWVLTLPAAMILSGVLYYVF